MDETQTEAILHFAESLNLDCEVSPDRLWSFGRAIAQNPRRVARRLFPAAPRGYVAATGDLGRYAENKATAMRCRLRGEILAASNYETICENIYDRLPEFARW